jgi:alpha/beta superfamily hydrolase
MDNNVVMAIARALGDAGHATLRFNFRGVGQSEGAYADGVGEIDDVRAALRFVRDNLDAATPSLLLAGYSFGAWVAAHALAVEDSVSSLVLVAPPTAMFDFSVLSADTVHRARHFIAGERDQFCDSKTLRDIIDRLPEPKSLSVVPDADHFFFGREQPVAEAVRNAAGEHP